MMRVPTRTMIATTSGKAAMATLVAMMMITTTTRLAVPRIEIAIETGIKTETEIEETETIAMIATPMTTIAMKTLVVV
jgi:hypothetical protein